MEFVHTFVSPVLAIASAIITIIGYLESKNRYKSLIVIVVFILASISVLSWNTRQKNQYDFELLSQKQKYEAEITKEKKRIISEDAKSVSDSIIITGYEDYGDYIGYLASIVGFYKRHNDLYSEEYSTLARQLNEWQEDLRELRKSGQTIYNSDYDGLKGLVKSGQDYLNEISGS